MQFFYETNDSVNLSVRERNKLYHENIFQQRASIIRQE